MVLDQGEAGSLQCLQAGRGNLGEHKAGIPADRHRATVTVPRPIAEISVGLQPGEVWQDVDEAPARIAERRPLVVIG